MKTKRAKTTENSKTNNWGGVREGAGRKKSENGKVTTVIRVDERLLPAIKILKEKQQAGQALEDLFTVTGNQEDLQNTIKGLDELVDYLKQKNDELITRNNDFIVKYNEETTRAENLKAELEQYKETGLKMVRERDKEYDRAIKLETSCHSFQIKNKSLREQLSALKHQEHDCQALTKNGTRCTKAAKLKTNWHGVEINVCQQHAKMKV